MEEKGRVGEVEEEEGRGRGERGGVIEAIA